MKAAVFEQVGQPLAVVDDVEIIDPRPGEVRVQVKACSICQSDLSVVNGTLPNSGPVILGHEAAGVVESVGAGVTQLQVGDSVVLTPLPPCGHCYFCQRNEHSLCSTNHGVMTGTLADGSTGLSRQGKPVLRGLGVGGFSEYVVSPASGAVKIPKDIPLDVACILGCALQTGVGAVLNTAKVEEGATVLITGLGGIGLAAVQGARIAGASTIVVSDPVAERRQLALELGASHAFAPAEANLVAECQALTNDIGIDYAFECAGSGVLIEHCISATRFGGSTVCVGSPKIDEALTINPAFMFTGFEKKLCGCMLGSSNSLFEIPRLVRFWQAGQLDLESMISGIRPLEEINEAMDDLAANRGIRTVLTIGCKETH